MAKLTREDYITEARRLACEKDGKAQRAFRKARKATEGAKRARLYTKANRAEQEAAVLRRLADYVEES